MLRNKRVERDSGEIHAAFLDSCSIAGMVICCMASNQNQVLSAQKSLVLLHILCNLGWGVKGLRRNKCRCPSTAS